MVIATKQRIKKCVATAAKNFSILISEEQAKQIIKWDDDNYFVKELDGDGCLDTYPLDYFSMAIIDLIMPEKPTVQDLFISRELEKWHFPFNGSSDHYSKAFWKNWKLKTKGMRIKR